MINNEIYVGTNDGIYKKNLINNDTIWYSLGLQGRSVTDFILFNNDTILVSTVASNLNEDTVSIFITYNSGDSWINFQNGFGGTSELYTCSALEINLNAPDTLFARLGVCMAKSIDGGMTWEEKYMDWFIGGFQDFIFDINPNIPHVIWAGGETGFYQPYILKSIDYGNTWQEILIEAGGDNACYSLLTNPNNNNEILVGMEGQIIKSTNGGENWNTIYNSSTYDYIIDMEISPNNSDLVYATGSKGGVGGGALFFYKSEDFGTSWETENYQLNNNIITFDLGVNSENDVDELFFATNKGIFQFSDSLTNIGSIKKQNDPFWTIYPNPITDYATLKFNCFKSEKYSLTLFNVYGTRMKTFPNIKTREIKITKDNLPSGVYIFQLNDGEKKVAFGKLIFN